MTTIIIASAAAPATPTTTALNLGTSFVDRERASADILTVEAGNGLVGRIRVGHFDESESA